MQTNTRHYNTSLRGRDAGGRWVYPSALPLLTERVTPDAHRLTPKAKEVRVTYARPLYRKIDWAAMHREAERLHSIEAEHGHLGCEIAAIRVREANRRTLRLA